MADDKRNSEESSWREREQVSRAWGILIFGLIGATVTTIAVSQLRRTGDWFYTQMTRSQPTSSSKSSSGRGSFREEAWNRYNRRMQEEYEEEMERVERIRRMQSVFNRERERYRRSYERWREYDNQRFQRDDWYWKSDTSYQDQRTNFRSSTNNTANYSMSHHYSVLGLDRSRAEPYTDAEIKTAFRAKAMECHPDQHQYNKEAAEAKFKEVMVSYEAIKLERKNGS